MSFDKMSTDEKIKKPFMKVEATPQPHFIPGYTGFCPDLPLVVGTSYARVTNEILKNRPEVAACLKPMQPEIPPPEVAHKREAEQMLKDKRLIKSRFPAEGRKVLNDYMMPGYSGHIPNSADAVGVSFSRGCVSSISKFLREQAEERKEDNKSL